MGEVKRNAFEPDFNRLIKVESTDQRLTSNAGVLLLREADQRLQMISSIGDELCDPREPRRIRYSLIELMRERVYSMGLGFSAQDDVDLLCHDPAFRMGGRGLFCYKAGVSSAGRLSCVCSAGDRNRGAVAAYSLG